MTRLRSLPVALLALVASAGVVAAVSLPSAATTGLATASEHAGRTVPAVPVTAGSHLAPDAASADAFDADAADLPDAAAHGAAVAAAAQADDATPDTNHGADVSAVARQSAGQAIAATHKPADPGKPADAGKPADVGPPEDVGRP